MSIGKQIVEISNLLDKVYEINEKLIPSKKREKLIKSYFNGIFTHLESSLFLLEKLHYPSVFILTRTNIDILFKASYILFQIQNEEDIDKIFLDEYKFPKFHEMAEILDQNLEARGFKDKFFNQFTKNGLGIYAMLSDSIHCGKISLKVFENIHHKFNRKEIEELITLNQNISIFATMILLLEFKEGEVLSIFMQSNKL